MTTEDLVVELHRIVDCKLVRDPEHGQLMFFALCEDGCVVFIFEGQDELDEDWKSHPQKLMENEKPRANLKIIRNPETKDCELLEFEGTELTLSECNTIALKPEQWPSNGKLISAPWGELKSRYKLKKL